jgi:hypothetical protein
MSNHQVIVTDRPPEPDPDLNHVYRLGALIVAADEELARIYVPNERIGRHFVKTQKAIDELKELVGALVIVYTLRASFGPEPNPN